MNERDQESPSGESGRAELDHILTKHLLEAVEAGPDIFCLFEANGQARYINKVGRKAFGLLKQDIEQVSISNLFSPSALHRLYNKLLPIALEAGVWSGEVTIETAEEREIPVSQVLLAHKNANGDLTHFSLVARDITAEKALRHQVMHDSLTQLPNRLLIRDRLAQALVHADRHNHRVGILFIDLNDFKKINDTSGHHVGDEVLRQVAQRLLQCGRKCDTIGRYGGDEFLVILDEVVDPLHIDQVAQKIKTAFVEPLHIGSADIPVSFSIGIARYPRDGSDTETLLENADAAMYRAKVRKNKFLCYTTPVSGVRQDALKADLRHGFRYEQFRLLYQPQVDLHSGRIAALEVQIHWQHPKAGLLTPTEIFPMLDETGTTEYMGQWLLERVCDQQQRWRAAGLGPLRIAMSLWESQIYGENLDQEISEFLSTEKRDTLLEFEFTERLLMHNEDRLAELLETFSNMGITLTLADFGTGYTPLRRLKRLPFHRLKIDANMVQGLGKDSKDAAMVAAMIVLGRGLGKEVIAAGVETQGQLNILRGQDCDIAQGRLFSQAVTAEVVEQQFGNGHWFL